MNTYNEVNYEICTFVEQGLFIRFDGTYPKKGIKNYYIIWSKHDKKGVNHNYNSIHFNNLWGKPYRSKQDAEKDFKELINDGHLFQVDRLFSR